MNDTTTDPTVFTTEAIAVDLIDPDPQNRAAVLEDAFRASIAQHGVLQPILVTPGDEGRYRLVAGERRWRAAIEAGHTTIPATVRAADDTTVGVWQAVENLNRVDLLPSQEAAAVARIMGAGMKQKALAAALGKPLSWVRARIAIVALPPDVQEGIDRGDWEVSDAITLAKWANRPEVIARAVDLDRYRDLDWRLERAEALLDAEHAVAVVRQQAAERGWTIYEGWNVTAAHPGAKPLTDLGIDPAAHETEPCHLLHVRGDSNTAAWCSEPKRHSKKGDSALIAPAKQKPQRTPAQVAEREAAKATKAANTRRNAYVADAIRAKLRSRDVTGFVLPVMLATAGQTELGDAGKLLGFEPTLTSWGHKDYVTPLREWATESTANLNRAMLAVAYCKALVHRHNAGDLLDTWLNDLGYDPNTAQPDT